MKTSRGLVAVCAALLMAGCRSSEDALLIGRLYGDPSTGCVWVGEAKGGLVDWPPFISVELDPLQVAGPAFVAEEGDWFRMSGGTRPEVPISPGCRVFVSEPASGKFVAGSVEYFGDERPSAEFGATP